jgi:hypothetical protein
MKHFLFSSLLLLTLLSTQTLNQSIPGWYTHAAFNSSFFSISSNAATTMLVMEQLTGARYVLQAGMLSIRLSENYRRKNPKGFTHFTMDGRPPYPGAPSGVENTLPEFHAWCGRIHSGSSEGGDEYSRHELIDLSARHYSYFVQAIDPEWPGVGDFSGKELWTTGDKLPEGITLIPDEATTVAVVLKINSEPHLSIIKRAVIKSILSLGNAGIVDIP